MLKVLIAVLVFERFLNPAAFAENEFFHEADDAGFMMLAAASAPHSIGVAVVTCEKQDEASYNSVALLRAENGQYAIKTVSRTNFGGTITNGKNTQVIYRPMPCKIDIHHHNFNGAVCGIDILETRFEKNADTGLFNVYQHLNMPNLPPAAAAVMNKVFGSGLKCRVHGIGE